MSTNKTASEASKTMRDPSASHEQKSQAASAMSSTKKTTGKK